MPQYPEIAGHVRRSQTSFDAAANVERRGKVTREILVYECVQKSPKTAWEICEALGLPYEVIHPRVFEMKSRGILGPSGDKRESKYGNLQDVLQITAPYSRKISGPKTIKKPENEKLKDLLVNIQLINTRDGHYQSAAIAIVRELMAAK